MDLELNKTKIIKHYKICLFQCLIFFTWLNSSLSAQLLPGFKVSELFSEQDITVSDINADVTVSVNAPLHFNKHGKTYLVLYALPNGNTIEWTKGKKMETGDDWHFDIQHIAAQARHIRFLDKKNNYIIAYLATRQKSWPAWKGSVPGSLILIKYLVDSLSNLFQDYNPKLILNGHSGGGSFIFGYLDAIENIPDDVVRIAFLDSNYGFEDSLHTEKITDWLKNTNHHLVVLAYNDSTVIYNGKPLVSPTGGTWYRSRLMQRKLAGYFKFSTSEDSAFIRHKALKGRISMVLKKNPDGLIFHTVQVEKNGFIYSLFSSTKFDKRKYFNYFGDRVYEKFISN